MMNPCLPFVLLLTIVVVQGNDVSGSISSHSCSGSISIAGTSSFRRLATVWAEEYQKVCPLSFQMDEDGWADGGARVCDNHLISPPVDMAGMSGKFFRPQAQNIDGFNFDCNQSNRKAMLVSMAYEGVALLVKANTLSSKDTDSAESCIIRNLGGGIGKSGLKLEQLRWMLSSLEASDFYQVISDKSVSPLLDGDGSTKYWSEVHQNCSASQIDLVMIQEAEEDGFDGPVVKFLKEMVLTDKDESLRPHHVVENAKELADFLYNNKAAVGIVQLGELTNPDLLDASTAVVPIAIRGKKSGSAFTVPTNQAFQTREYYLSRPVTLGLNNDPDSLALTMPFIEYGSSEIGEEILRDRTGFRSITSAEKALLKTRLGAEGGVVLDADEITCPSHGISIDGSTAGVFIALPWAGLFQIPCHVDISVEAGGSTIGAKRICGIEDDDGTPLDISIMSRPWKDHEATNEAWTEDFVYDCVQGDSSRSVVQLNIGIDSLVLAVRAGTPGDQCLKILGGLTLDQLRWIYSNYTEEELKATRWDPSSLQNSDSNDSTHRWSELHPSCANVEIRTSGHPVNEGGFDTFVDIVLADSANGETIDLDRPGFEYMQGIGEEVISAMLHYTDAISFVSYSFFSGHDSEISAVPIMNENGVMVAPTPQSFKDGTYNRGFVRRITANVLNDEKHLKNTIPFLQLGLSQPELLSSIGLVPISEDEREEMIQRLHQAPYTARFDADDDEEETLWVILVASAAAFVFLLCCLCGGYVMARSK